jgi:predicted kinase
MAMVHMIHGYLGSGKTTFARKLEQELPALRFTHDEWMTRLFGDDPPADLFPEFFRRVSEQIDSIWPRCLELGIEVVLDLNFWSRKQRARVRAIASELGVGVRLYQLSCPDEIAWRRIEKRNRERQGSLFISRNTFEILKARFEPLGDDEERIVVNQ